MEGACEINRLIGVVLRSVSSWSFNGGLGEVALRWRFAAAEAGTPCSIYPSQVLRDTAAFPMRLVVLFGKFNTQCIPAIGGWCGANLLNFVSRRSRRLALNMQATAGFGPVREPQAHPKPTHSVDWRA